MDVGKYEVTTIELDVDTCWRLLHRAWVGRVGFVDRQGPVVLPVNCVVWGPAIVFRTDQNTALYGLATGATVAFEADGIDSVAESGWSVLVRGQLYEVTDAEELARMAELPLHPWVAGEKDRWMKIVSSLVTGRLTSRHRVPPGQPGVSIIPPD
jgi:nitroimidazol reductase NimA-like FMN-containing flavoprotein (pyridoxamine 5'-phosphate oxidase superfamily)